MNRQWYRFPQLILLSLLLAIPIIAFPSLGLAAGAPGLRVSGAILVTEVSPGQTLTHKMEVGLGDSDLPADIIVQIGDLGQALDGGYQIISPPATPSQFSASGYITADKDKFHLEPGASQAVNLTIRIPQDVAAGGKYALINVRTAPTGLSSIGMISAVNVPIYLTIKNTQLAHTGKINELKASDVESGKPVEIMTLFQSTGNHHFKVKGEVTISDNDGKKLETIDLALSASSVIPGLIRGMKAVYTPPDGLPPGMYNVKSRVMLEDDTVLDETTGRFEVKIPYVPPAPPASITLLPSSAATLKTDDGRISISFAKSSVISEAKISIRSYPPEQLRAAPADFRLANTCFRVDGLTGLLAKDADIQVKYSPADLEKAGGNASKLVLARWDESSGQWTILKTGVDASSTTLSTSTNQFSIWAVMVGKTSTAATINWTLIGSIIGIIVIVLVILLLKAVRPKLHPR